jgi:hypothetical protein
MAGAPAPGSDWARARHATRARDLPRTRAGDCVRDYLASFAPGDSVSAERFARARCDSTFRVAGPAGVARRQALQVGPLQLRGYALRADGTIALLLWSAKLARWLEYRFVFAPGGRLHAVERVTFEPAAAWKDRA